MTYDNYAPVPPFEPFPMHVKGSDTSEAAAESVRPVAKTLRDEVLRIIKIEPCTCDHVEHVMGGRHQTISARVRELVMMGKIQDSGRREKTRSGRSARVYEAVGPEAQVQLF